MYLPALVLVASVGAGYLAGGRLQRIEQLRVRWWPLAPLGLVMQFLELPRAIDPAGTLTVLLLIFSYVVLLTFVGANIRAPGFPLLFVGLGLNLAVIAPNGGMPVSADALRESGQSASLPILSGGGSAKHDLMREDHVLAPLGDVIAVGPPLGQVLSLGDLVLYAGLGWTVMQAMRGPSATALPVPSPGSHRGYRGKHRPYRHLPRVVRTSPPPPAAARSGTGP